MAKSRFTLEEKIRIVKEYLNEPKRHICLSDYISCCDFYCIDKSFVKAVA